MNWREETLIMAIDYLIPSQAGEGPYRSRPFRACYRELETILEDGTPVLHTVFETAGTVWAPPWLRSTTPAVHGRGVSANPKRLTSHLSDLLAQCYPQPYGGEWLIAWL
jgi:hypothetical protein